MWFGNSRGGNAFVKHYFSLHNWIKKLPQQVNGKFLFISPLVLKHYYRQENQIKVIIFVEELKYCCALNCAFHIFYK